NRRPVGADAFARHLLIPFEGPREFFGALAARKSRSIPGRGVGEVLQVGGGGFFRTGTVRRHQGGKNALVGPGQQVGRQHLLGGTVRDHLAVQQQNTFVVGGYG